MTRIVEAKIFLLALSITLPSGSKVSWTSIIVLLAFLASFARCGMKIGIMMQLGYSKGIMPAAGDTYDSSALFAGNSNGSFDEEKNINLIGPIQQKRTLT